MLPKDCNCTPRQTAEGFVHARDCRFALRAKREIAEQKQRSQVALDELYAEMREHHDAHREFDDDAFAFVDGQIVNRPGDPHER